MEENAKVLWTAIVDVAKPSEQLAFIQSIVTQLAVLFEQTGELPVCREIRIIYGIRSISFYVYPAGDIGERLVKLSALLVDPECGGEFHVGATEFADVQPEDVSAGRVMGRKPGLLLSTGGYPALILGGEPERLVLKMEGFERAIIGLTADVPRLWDNVRREQGWNIDPAPGAREVAAPRTRQAGQVAGNVQRERERQKRSLLSSAAGILRLVLPAATIRPVVVSAGSSANPGNSAVLVPIRGQKVQAGAYPTRPQLGVLREALGVQALIAEHHLRALLDDRKKAVSLLEGSLVRSYRHVRDIGTERLADWTEFDCEKALEAWAEAYYADAPRARRIDRMATRINSVLDPLALVGKALSHAERICAAHDLAEAADVTEAAEIIEKAHSESPHSGFDADRLFDIAMHANIQPAMFWRVEDEAVVEVFEAARVLGRVRDGAKAVMSPMVLNVVFEGRFALALPPERDEKLIALRKRAADGLFELLGADRLERMLAKVEDTGEYLLVERKTRKVKAITPKKALKMMFRRKKWPK